ncbi:Leucine-rich repeat domain L domain-like [Trinorchestia longiramus]|nr:Leucine-rich repeat domain L domain-like [Trinorchestia longiramus]
MRMKKLAYFKSGLHMTLMTWWCCSWTTASTETMSELSVPASFQRQNDRFSSDHSFQCPPGKSCLDLSVSRKIAGDESFDYIYASSSSCSQESLQLSSPTLLHSSIGAYCGRLMDITLEGGGWDCSWDGWDWLREWHETEQGVLHQPSLNCQNVSANCTNTDREFSTGLHYQQACMVSCTHKDREFSTGLHYQQACMASCTHTNDEFILGLDYLGSCMQGEKDCGPCHCSFTYNAMLRPPSFISTVDCTSRNLSDETVPPNLPRNSDFLAFGSNRLKTAKTLMSQAARMPHLRAIYLNDNLLTSLPDIDQVSSVGYILLENNSIEQLMSGNFTAYLDRSNDLSIRIKDNPLKCGCEFYIIDKKLRERGGKKNILQFIEDFLGIECPDGPLPKLYPDESCPDYVAERHDSKTVALNFAIAIMGILNVVLILLNIDLQKAIRDLKRGYNEPHEPLIHRICSAVCDCFKRLRSATLKSTLTGVPQEDVLNNRLEHHSFISKSMRSNSNDH